MKKDLLTHFSFMIALFILVSLFKRWVAIEYLPFWFGGILGTLLPDVDHLIYVYLLQPRNEVSQKVSTLISERKVTKTWDTLASMRVGREELMFHTAFFQLIFVVFALLIITSSGSLLGTGLVLAFSLHLLIDEVMDLLEIGNLDSWFRNLPLHLDNEQRRWFLVVNGLILLSFGLFL